MIGQTIAHYKITAELGKGGMGEVYRATDLKLGRDVALKILPESFARDPERMARFQREAHVLASLNHPNIAAIYGVEERALVMELVEGPTLADLIKPGPIALEQALKWAKQMAEAFECAHDKGVVHRDLKPANVKVTPEGVVKVLDFGLAKIADEGPGPGDPENSPTLTMAATKMGVIIGTAAYMAPEQASGVAVDKRADIWSFGVVLWEMLAGARMFSGQTVSHTLAAVLTKEFDWNQLPGATPAAIRQLLRRCLEREVKNRLRDIGEARVVLEEQLAHPVKEAETKPAGTLARPRWAMAAAVCAVAATLAAAAVSYVHFRERPAEESVVRFPIFLPPRTIAETFSAPVISPDGKMFVLTASGAGGKRSLWLRSMDSESFQILEGTDDGFYPFWSPDSRSIGFFSSGKLKKVDARGGAPLTLCDWSFGAGGGTWNRDGVIVFGAVNLQRVPAGGGEPKPLLALDKARQEVRQTWPSFLPDGKHFVYLSQSSVPEKNGIYLGSLDSKEPRLLMPGDSNAMYAEPGFLLFSRQQTLLARAFDADKLEFTGDAFPLAERVGAVQLQLGALFSVSQNGVLVSRPPLLTVVQLTWHGRNGQKLTAVGEPGEYRQFVLAPDQDRVFIERPDPNTASRDIWMLVMASGIFSRMTLNPASEGDAALSPDGRELVFSSNRNARTDLYKKVIGTGEDELILSTPEAKYPEQVLVDGSILYISQNGKSIFRLPPAAAGANRKPELLFQTGFQSDEPQVSPDSRWIAYSTNETGRWEIYAASFPKFTEKRQISNNGGYQPKWRKDGKELYYLSLDGKLMAVDITAGAALTAGAPKLLFQTSVAGDWRLDQYGVSADGQRFLYGEPLEQEEKPIHVVLNWPASVVSRK